MVINISVTGRPFSGKTSLISSIYKALDASMPGYFRLPETEDFDALGKSWDNLKASASSSRSEFAVKFTGSDNSEIWEYDVLMKSGRDELTFCFQEDPEDTRDTKIFVAVIDTPLLMSGHEEASGVKEAVDVFTKALNDGGSRLLLVVPVKCEAYTRRDNREFLARISEAFSEVAELSRTEYRGRSAVAVIPVHTMGGAAFSEFLRDDGKISGEKFKRDKNVNFRPEFADQVMRFAVSFLIHDGAFKTEGKELNATVMKIASSAGLNDERFAILSGHELLEPNAPVKKSGGWKVAAMIAGLVVLAGAGYYAFVRMDRQKQAVIDESTRQAEEAASRAQQEIELARSSEQSAITERDDAMKEASTLLREKVQAEKRAERAEQLAGRYKSQNEALQAEIRKLRAELESVKSQLEEAGKKRKKFLGIF